VRDKVLAANPRMKLKAFMALTDEELYRYVVKLVRPKQPLEFIEKLKKYVSFELRSSFKATVDHFNYFYEALLQYRNDFLRVYELMAEDNADAMPACNEKKNGLPRIFMDEIPFEYGDRVWTTLKKKPYRTVSKFLKAFYQVVELHFTHHEKTKELQQAFGGTAWEASKSDTRPPRLTEPRLHALGHDDESPLDDPPPRAAQDEQEIYSDDDVVDQPPVSSLLQAPISAEGANGLLWQAPLRLLHQG